MTLEHWDDFSTFRFEQTCELLDKLGVMVIRALLEADVTLDVVSPIQASKLDVKLKRANESHWKLPLHSVIHRSIHPCLVVVHHNLRMWFHRDVDTERIKHNFIVSFLVHLTQPLRNIGHWQLQLALEMQKRLNLYTPVFWGLRVRRESWLPGPLWSLAGQKAWSQPEYEQQILNIFESYIHHSILQETGYSLSGIVLHPNTYWLLLALAVSNTRDWFAITERIIPPRVELKLDDKRLTRLRKHLVNLLPVRLLRGYIPRIAAFIIHPGKLRRQRRINYILQRIFEEGKKPASQTGWASIWDQWILLEAYEQWRYDRLPEPLVAPIAQLPLRQYGVFVDRGDYSTEKVGEKIQLAAPDWQAALPAWFEQWFTFKRQVRRSRQDDNNKHNTHLQSTADAASVERTRADLTATGQS